MVSRFLPLLPLLFTACASSSSGPEPQGCTLIGCVNGFNVTIAASGVWKAGKYEVKVVADGVTTTCTATLPLSADSASVCTGPGVQISLSGSALPAAQQSIPDVTLTGTPAMVSITFSRDGAALGSQTYTPSYKTTRPNGPSCEPICTSAGDTLTLTL